MFAVVPAASHLRLMASEPSATPLDQRLLARMAQGDEAALAELYDRHAGPVHSMVSAIVKNAADAEEVTTDVFVQAWSTAGRFDPERGSADGWLLTLARSRALDRVRSRGRRAARLERSAAREGDELAVPLSNPGPDPERRTEQVELRGRVRHAMDGLPDPQREALELAYFGGLSQREIADRLQTPLGTVKTRIRAGLMKLRESLAPLRPGEQA